MNATLETADKMIVAFEEMIKDNSVAVVGINMVHSDSLLHILNIWRNNLSK